MAVVVDRKAPKSIERTGMARRRLLAIVGILTLVVGIGSFAGGVFGAVYTWNQAAAENITTPDDAFFRFFLLESRRSVMRCLESRASVIIHHPRNWTMNVLATRRAERP